MADSWSFVKREIIIEINDFNWGRSSPTKSVSSSGCSEAETLTATGLPFLMDANRLFLDFQLNFSKFQCNIARVQCFHRQVLLID